MMPASRAVPSTSPFLALPFNTRLSVALAIRTQPSATAMRSVAGLSETSTMRASPEAPRWVRRRATALPRRRRCGLARQQRAGCRRYVGLPHQTFADQKTPNPDAGQPRQIGRRVDAAFADDHAAGRNLGRKLLADRERGREGLQVAVVNSDQPRAQFQGALQL